MTGDALYTGATVHRRLEPSSRRFRAPLTMVLLDHDWLERADGPTRRGGPLGPEWWWPIHYRRSDYLDGDEGTALGTAVRDLVEVRTGSRPRGPVRTLTQVRTHGYVFNPLTVHYCLAPGTGDDERPELEVVVLEVTNTPWKERHCYVADARPGVDAARAAGPVARASVDERGRLSAEMPKALHVSPFMPMEQTYRLTCTAPSSRLWLRLETVDAVPPGAAGPTKVFEADVALQRSPLTRAALARRLLSHPLATHRVWAGIHAHAVALAARRVPFFSHPDRAGTGPPGVGTGPVGKVEQQ